jgi:hypothetical protein
MSVTGQIVAGHVVLDTPAALPEGTRVRVEPLADGAAHAPEPAEMPKTLAERMSRFLTHTVDLPEDAALQHDHYLYGHPKK